MESNNEWNCWVAMEREQGFSFFRQAWEQRGAGGSGTFQTYMPFSEYTEAAFLQKAGVKTPVAVKFGSLEGSFVDTARDTKGIALKFQTEQGTFDLLCSSYPVAAYQDCNSFCDYIRAIRPDAASNLIDSKQYWNYMAKHEAGVYQMLLKYSDLGTRKSYERMEWFSLFPHEWINSDGQMHLVRYLLRPLSFVECINRQEAEFLSGFDPDIARRNLFDSLADGIPIEYELLVQLMPEARMRAAAFDPLNPTCRWCANMAVELAVGKLTIQEPCRHDEDQSTDRSFSVRQMVDGIRLANLPLARLVAMLEPRRPIKSSENVFSFAEYGKNGRNQEQHTYRQAAVFYDGLSEEQRNHLRGNLLDELIFMEDTIQREIVGNLSQVSIPLAKEIEKGLTF